MWRGRLRRWGDAWQRTTDDGSRCLDLVCLLGVDHLEMFHVPGVDHRGFNLSGASKKKGIVNAAARESTVSSALC
jgi:hypothetical protein